MRSENSTGGQKSRSVIEEARRAQIVENAIETFAEVGYGETSLAQIAARAGISKGVISYHFAGKDELVEQVIRQVYDDITQFVAPRVQREPSALGKLRTRLGAVAEYVRGHRSQLLALVEIFNNFLGPDGEPRYGYVFNEPLYQSQERIFRAGQESGEMRAFDVRVMAVTLESAIDAMIGYWATYPEHDLEAHANELADLFVHATRAEHLGEAAQ